MASAAGMIGLTAREAQVLALVGTGWSVADVADELALLPEAVSAAIDDVRLKTGAANRVQMVAIAARNGWLPPVD